MRLPFLPGLAAAWCFLGSGAAAQMINYGEALAGYKDSVYGGVKLNDTTTPRVAAKARVARAMREGQVVDERALLQPDGTLKLPRNQTNLVLRTDSDSVRQGADGSVRIASPTIEGNVSGNVTVVVDGQGVDNITVLNGGR